MRELIDKDINFPLQPSYWAIEALNIHQGRIKETVNLSFLLILIIFAAIVQKWTLIFEFDVLLNDLVYLYGRVESEV